MRVLCEIGPLRSGRECACFENCLPTCPPPPLPPQQFTGPHGAGLTNVVYAPRAALVELPMDPHTNVCFNYMATALQHDYYVVPEVACFYHRKYKMDSLKADAVVRTVVAALAKQREKFGKAVCTEQGVCKA